MLYRLTTAAQFIAVCSSSILAETLSYAVSFSSPWRGKRRVLEWHKPVLIDQLQPSTNSDKLSDNGLSGLFSWINAYSPNYSPTQKTD
jgi:hypothetical protein